LIEASGGKNCADFKSMKQEWNARRLTRDPFAEKVNVLAPILKTHFFKDAGTLANATIIKTKDLNPMRS
jgi:hypothetical protein